MRQQLILILCLFWAISVKTVAQTDTTIVQVPEVTAHFPGCNELTGKQLDSCSQSNLMRFMYANLHYPLQARQEGKEGTVVTRFVVEKDGQVTHAKILKDIGAGCGEEVLRIVHGMDSLKIRWNPATVKGKIVRSYVTFPVKFKLQEEPPYTFVDGDTVYVKTDTPVAFIKGDSLLGNYLDSKIKIPKMLNDSCKAGAIQLTILVEPTGKIKTIELLDYSDLGADAQFEAISRALDLQNQFIYATYKGRNVPASYNLRMSFMPTAPNCKNAVEKYHKALALADEADAINSKGDIQQALAKLNEAVALSPKNAEILYMRGMLNVNLKNNEQACKDLSIVKEQLKVNWMDTLIPFVCRK